MAALRISRAILFHSAVILLQGTLLCRGQDIRSLLPHPNEIGPWHMADSSRVFTGDELYSLIDGGADVYLEYGFQRVLAAEFENRQERSIKLEVYEMTDPAAAFGVFSLNIGSQGTQVAIGNEGMQYEYYIMFWKDRYIVFVSGNDTLGETSAAIKTIAACVDKKIDQPGTKPPILKYLPSRELKKSIYLRGILGLSTLYTFDTKNIFGMKEGIYGQYPSHQVFLFPYETQRDAAESFENAQKVLQMSNRFQNFQKSTNRLTMVDRKARNLCVTIFKRMIIIVLAKTEASALNFSKRVQSFVQIASGE